MGFTNGQNIWTITTQKGEKGEKGIGFLLTDDNHFHLENRRLTNIGPPIDNFDGVNKKYLLDSLKPKAATTYVKNELNKKANISLLDEYMRKDDYDFEKKADIGLLDYYVRKDELNDEPADEAYENVIEEKVYLHFWMLNHDNSLIVSYDPNNCLGTKDKFEINNNDIKILVDGIYEITFIDSYRNQTNSDIPALTFRVNGSVKRYTHYNKTSGKWLELTFNTFYALEKNDIISISMANNVLLDGGVYSTLTIKKI